MGSRCRQSVNVSVTNTDLQATDTLQRAIGSLDAWLETMRQPGGYGGPIAHWWQNRFRYTGPGLDWRYEGILCGYADLYRQSGADHWRQRLNRAARDLVSAQRPDGHYPASRFEINPGIRGTPHEAAASLGLLYALDVLDDPDSALDTARRNLDSLIADLRDPDHRGFNDALNSRGRVPNKLATFAEALLRLAVASGDERYADEAKAALDDVVAYQHTQGSLAGAVHQYAPGAAAGDGRFFPYYNARCIPPLLYASETLNEPHYRQVAHDIFGFLDRTEMGDGGWPQVVYARERPAVWPRWLAGSADILLAYHALGQLLPARSLTRLLDSQQPSGGFPTAEGFAAQIRQRPPHGYPDYRDVVAVVGWNDKVLRLLATLARSKMDDGAKHSPDARDTLLAPTSLTVRVWGSDALFYEDTTTLRITRKRDDALLYEWDKHAPWAAHVDAAVDVR